MDEARPRRVFFALWPDEEAGSHLAALGNELAGRSGRVMPPAALHLTLAFIGAVAPDRIAVLDEVAAAVRADVFDLSLDRLGFWPQRGILWAGCRMPPAPLRDLAHSQKNGLRAAGFAIDQGPTVAPVPHVTLARRVSCPSLPRLGTPIRWQVGEFALVESHLQPSGANYRTLHRYALDQPDAG